MIAAIPVTQPYGAAIRQKALRFMDVILHIGAHRCATTSFQHYMRRNKPGLGAQGIGFWGPLRTRAGLFRGIQPGPEIRLGRDVRRRAIGRVQLGCTQSARQGVRQLVVSDENMLGSMRGNTRFADLYSGAGERMARFGEAFSGFLTDIVINIRSPEMYWASTFGYLAGKGRGLPAPGLLQRVTDSDRGWREVITDIAWATPGVRIHVVPFEGFAGRPDAQLAAVTGQSVPLHATGERHNQSPDLPQLRTRIAAPTGALPTGDGRWMPFAEPQRAILRERYADDLMWLVAGADGLAQLADDPTPHKAGAHLPDTDMTEGRYDERRHRQVARAGRR